MPTSNPRLNVTVSTKTAGMLARLAKREGKSVASFAKDLILDGLDRREDIALSLFAERCERKQKGKKVYSHAEAWK